MTRTKFTLVAPQGVTESLIEGTYYWPEQLGETANAVQTTNAEHKRILEQHGYALVDASSIAPPMGEKSLIETEECGRSALVAALQDRGLSFDVNAAREELVILADNWNRARRQAQRIDAGVAIAAAPAPSAPSVIEGLTHEQAIAELARLRAGQAAPVDVAVPAAPPAAPAPEPAAPPAPAAVAPAPGTVGAPQASAIHKPDFATVPYNDLKAWLVARGVTFKGNAARSDLVALAEKTHADIVAKKAAAAEPETV